MSQKLSTSTLKFIERRAPIQHGSVHGLLNVRRAMRSAVFQRPVWQRWCSNDFRPDSNKSSSEHFYEPWRSTPAAPAEYETIIAQPSTPGPQQNPNHFSQKLPANDMGDMNIAEDHWYWSVKEQQHKERQLISQARELLTSRSRNPEAHPVQRALQDLKARTQLLSEGASSLTAKVSELKQDYAKLSKLFENAQSSSHSEKLKATARADRAKRLAGIERMSSKDLAAFVEGCLWLILAIVMVICFFGWGYIKAFERWLAKSIQSTRPEAERPDVLRNANSEVLKDALLLEFKQILPYSYDQTVEKVVKEHQERKSKDD